MRRPASNIKGTPAIPTPGRLDLAVLQQLSDNVRERLRQVDAECLYLRSLAESSVNGQSLALLQQQVSQLSARVTALGVATGVDLPEDTAPAQSGASAVLAEFAKALDAPEPATTLYADMAELTKELDAPAPAITLYADVAELTKRVQGLEEGVLL